jgi:4-amino-4-deoxy-L-arabinose transferase-like glycosyltransferase
MAQNLINGRGVVDNMGNYAMYNVGYPLFLLAPMYLAFGEHLLAARLANVGLGVVSILLCYQLARQAGAGRLGRLLAAAGWAVYQPASTASA